jgi:hypothetical protein
MKARVHSVGHNPAKDPGNQKHLTAKIAKDGAKIPKEILARRGGYLG